MTSAQQLSIYFDGPPDDDSRQERLGKQFNDISALMRDGAWRTLKDIARRTGYPEASISAQLRHMRKPRFGGHAVERRHIEHGLYEYRVIWRRQLNEYL